MVVCRTCRKVRSSTCTAMALGAEETGSSGGCRAAVFCARQRRWRFLSSPFHAPLLYLPPLPRPPCSSCSINPVTGRVEEKLPNPMEGMTEEQKEYEAMKLVNMFDKLSRY